MKAWLFCCVSGLNAAKFVCKADPAEMYHLPSIGKAAQARVCLYSLYSFKTQPLHPAEPRDTQKLFEHSNVLCTANVALVPSYVLYNWKTSRILLLQTGQRPFFFSTAWLQPLHMATWPHGMHTTSFSCAQQTTHSSCLPSWPAALPAAAV